MKRLVARLSNPSGPAVSQVVGALVKVTDFSGYNIGSSTLSGPPNNIEYRIVEYDIDPKGCHGTQ